MSKPKEDPVHPGQVIGQVGSTGNSVGPHIHFEAPTKGVRLTKDGKTIEAVKPTTVTQLKSQGWKVEKFDDKKGDA